MKKKDFASTAKRFFIVTFKIIILAIAVLWAFGIRLEHLKILKLLFPEPMELSAQEQTEVHDWLQKNTINLNTIEAGSGFEDMMPLKALIGDASIVSH